jgi:GntR family transcriptional regulator
VNGATWVCVAGYGSPCHAAHGCHRCAEVAVSDEYSYVMTTGPLHDQVAAEIRRAIAEGEAGPGERLPLAKDIAAVLGVNKNTVLRAMHILRDEGLVEFGRGKGITVSGTPQRSAVMSRVQELVDFARQHGYRRDEVIDLIAGLP